MVREVIQDYKVLKENQEIKVTMVIVAHKGFKVLKVIRETKEIRGIKVM